MSADATAGSFPWESAVVYKTDVRGFSVSIFWPMSPAKSARNVGTRKKRKRRRKSRKRTDEGTQCLVARHDAVASESSSSSERTQGDKPDVLVNDHPAGSNMNTDSESEGVSLYGLMNLDVTRDNICKFGYALRGERPVYHCLLHRGKRVSAIVAFLQMLWWLLNLPRGTVNGDRFIDYFRGSLIPNSVEF